MLDKLYQIHLIAPSSAIYDLNSQNLYIVNWTDGLGAAPFHRFSERSAGQHGVTDLGFRLDARLIDFHMTLVAVDPTAYWYRRATMLDFIKPSVTPFIMQFLLSNSVNPDLERCLHCYLYKGLSFDTRKRKGLSQEADFTLIAPDPVFYDPTAWTSTLTFTYGDSYKEVTLPIQGNWASYPQIVIEGPVLNPCIVNLGTNEKIALAYQVAVGETVTIECAYGLKTIKNGSGTNLISKLTTDSDFSTFHVDPDLTGSDVNKMHLTGTLTAGQTCHVTFNYYDRYVGI